MSHANVWGGAVKIQGPGKEKVGPGCQVKVGLLFHSSASSDKRMVDAISRSTQTQRPTCEFLLWSVFSKPN